MPKLYHVGNYRQKLNKYGEKKLSKEIAREIWAIELFNYCVVGETELIFPTSQTSLRVFLLPTLSN